MAKKPVTKKTVKANNVDANSIDAAAEAAIEKAQEAMVLIKSEPLVPEVIEGSKEFDRVMALSTEIALEDGSEVIGGAFRNVHDSMMDDLDVELQKQRAYAEGTVKIARQITELHRVGFQRQIKTLEEQAAAMKCNSSGNGG